MTEQEKKAEQEAKNFINSLSEEQLQDLKDTFSSAMNKVIKSVSDGVKSIQNQIDSKEKTYKELREKERLSSYPENREIFEERQEIGKQINQLKFDLLSQKNSLQAVENGGTIIEITDKKGGVHKNIADFRKLDTNAILFEIDSILTDKQPVYIPVIDEESFERAGFVFDAIRFDKDSYLLSIKKYREKGVNNFVIVTLDQLVLNQDYYYKRAKAKKIKEAEEINQRALEHWDGLEDDRKRYYLMQAGIYHSLPAKIKKTISKEEYDALDWREREKIYKFYKRYGVKRLKPVLHSDTMWTSFHDMYERFINPEAASTERGKASREVSIYWLSFKEMMDYKLLDINIQRKELSQNYKTALETSFGESNTSDVLKDEFGVLVKRQNGTQIKAPEIDQIRNAIISIRKQFGNLKPNFLKYNIKISHTGVKHVFASRALGVYIPTMGTIAISDKYGDEQFKMTGAHEFAHFIDHLVGETNKKRWATDDYESTAGKIAFAFRNNMNKPKSKQTDYINATVECFARALQQYYGIETFGEDVGTVWGSEEDKNFKPFFFADNFVPKDAYYNTIKPLIEQFFSEHKDIFEYAVDIDNSEAPTPLGDETEIDIDATITDLETSLKITPDNKQIIEAINALKTLKEIDKMEDGGQVKQVHEYGCAMLYFNNPQLEEIHSQINPEDIYTEQDDNSYGLEGEPHTTLLYGLHPEVSDEEVFSRIRSEEFPSTITLKNVSLFENDNYDVLKFDVEHPILNKVNKKLTELPYTTDYPDYHPHSTIAYIKKGKGKGYVKKFNGVSLSVVPEQVVYSKTDGSRVVKKIYLNKR